jgi:hypothetical protein
LIKPSSLPYCRISRGGGLAATSHNAGVLQVLALSRKKYEISGENMKLSRENMKLSRENMKLPRNKHAIYWVTNKPI